MAHLVPITRENWRAAAGVRVGAGQLGFVAGHEPVALVILAKAFVRVADLDWWPYLVEEGGDVVGVLALVDERVQGGQLALFHLVIDVGRQGHGLGRAAVRLVLDLARGLDGCRRVRLTVDPANHVAIRLYVSEGFVEDGVDERGELRFSRPV